MLATAFPPLPFFRTPAFDEMFEALCLCNLAKYPHDTLTERSINSFKRAWGMTTIYSQAADANGTPGWKVAEWINTFQTGPASRKLVIAIDGITSLVDAGVFELAPAAYYNFQGRVKARWKLFADTIEQVLAANFGLDATANRINTQITFAGWSAGASTAELLAHRFNAQYQFPAVKLFTFAKPQTGNARWNLLRSARVQRQNFLLAGDPICTLPGGGNNLDVFAGLVATSSNLCRDPDVLVYGLNGFNRGGYTGGQNSSGLLTALQYWSDGGNSFEAHDRRLYLTACAHFCAGLYESLRLRILNSEYPDANNIGAQWEAGLRPIDSRLLTAWDTLFSFAAPEPSDIEPNEFVRRELNLLAAPRPIVTQTTVRADTAGTSVGGDWGDPPPGPRTVLTSEALRRRLRLRR